MSPPGRTNPPRCPSLDICAPCEPSLHKCMAREPHNDHQVVDPEAPLSARDPSWVCPI